MGKPFPHQIETEKQQKYYNCLPLEKRRSFSNPFPVLGFCVIKHLRNFYLKTRLSNGLSFKRVEHTYIVVNNSMFGISPGLFEKERAVMEKNKAFNEIEEEVCDLVGESGFDCSSSSGLLPSETTGQEENSHSSSEESSSPLSCSSKVAGVLKPRVLEKKRSSISEIEMMKERFSKLLLGEDMSGSGNGVSTALAISNAITNLCATLFGQLWRLEPLPTEKKVMWRREMEWLLCVSDHIVEFGPSWQTFPDGSKLEVMTCRPRSDLYVNLPALKKLDNMLIDILDSFEHTEFWYVDQGISASEEDKGSSSFRKVLQRQEEKWWLPVPRVPPGGLQQNVRKQLQHTRDCTNQILKAAMAINSITLADMEVPESYYDSLPKNGRASLGDIIYRYITSDQFYPECLLDCIDLSSEHQAIEIANRVEATMFVWRKRNIVKPITTRSTSRSSWELVKEYMVDAEKREMLADRAENLLLCLKQRFPGLPQTSLDMSKIQYNKDVGKSILESYSRVLESQAFNIIARIDDLLYVDDLIKHSDDITEVGTIGENTVSVPFTVPHSSSPYKTAFTTPSFSPVKERSPFITSGKTPSCRVGAKQVLTDYVTIENRGAYNRNGPYDTMDSIAVDSEKALA